MDLYITNAFKFSKLYARIQCVKIFIDCLSIKKYEKIVSHFGGSTWTATAWLQRRGRRMDQAIADLLYEARQLKEISRSGYQYLGVGRESVAEHTFMVAFISHVMARLQPDVDALKLLRMSLLHDLPEARIGDLNAVQKKYVTADESQAVSDLTGGFSFGGETADLLSEFRDCRTVEARLAHDADQLSLLIDLKAFQDIGHASPAKWIAHVRERMITDTGRKLAEDILATDWDHWWMKDF